MKMKLVENLVSTAKGVLGRTAIAIGVVRFTEGTPTPEELLEKLQTAVHALESSEPHTFHSESGDIGPKEAAILREAVIRARDSALTETRFDEAVNLSHAIAFMQMAGEYIWGADLEALRHEIAEAEKPKA